MKACRARGAWSKEAQPILKAAGFQMEVFETQAQGHAFKIVQDLNLQSTDAILCVGGDGTMSEVVQVWFSSRHL